MGLRVIAREVDFSDDGQHPRSHNLDAQRAHALHIRQVEQRLQNGTSYASSSLFADEERRLPDERRVG